MRKWLLLGLTAAGIAAVVTRLRRGGSGYDDDAIDAAGQGATFGERAATAPEQQMAPAETRADVTAEQLSMAARLDVSLPAIRAAWPAVTDDDVRGADGDIDRAARTIAEKVEQPLDQVRSRLDGILAQETPRAGYPAH